MSGIQREEEGVSEAGLRLRRTANFVVDSPSPMGSIMKLPLKERLAVALILDRRDLFVDGDFTILQAVDYLGDEWVKMALAVQSAWNREMED